MKTAHVFLIAALAISLSGCVVSGKPKPTPPPAPQPAPPPPPPAPPPQPLSMPQTEVQLPPVQPVPENALDMVTATEVQPAPPPPTRTSNKRRGPTPSTPPVAAPPAEQATPPATPPANATASPETERPDVHEVLPPNERIRLQNNADSQKRTVRTWLASSKGRKLDSTNNPTVQRIKSLLQTSDEAETKGDMREASELADHAVAYMRELQGAH